MQMSFYIAFLRALYLFYTNAHWLTLGAKTYQLHLLFKKLYKMTVKITDSASEKTIGLFGKESLDITKQNELIFKIMSKHCSSETDLVENAILFETAFFNVAQQIRKELKNSDKIPEYFENFLLNVEESSADRLSFLKNPESIV